MWALGRGPVDQGGRRGREGSRAHSLAKQTSRTPSLSLSTHTPVLVHRVSAMGSAIPSAPKQAPIQAPSQPIPEEQRLAALVQPSIGGERAAKPLGRKHWAPTSQPIDQRARQASLQR